MTHSPAILATHSALGGTSRRFLDFVDRCPEVNRRLDYWAAAHAEEVPDWELNYHKYPIQTWPALAEQEMVREVERVTRGVVDLVRSIPERLCGNDPERFSRQFDVDDPGLAMLLLEPPTGLPTAVARCDLIHTESGFKCLEVNMGANIGGWDLRFWKNICLRNPPIARFLAEEGITPRYRDPVRILLAHLITSSRPFATGGRLNIAFIFDIYQVDQAACGLEFVDSFYSELLGELEPSLRGRLVITSYSELSLRNGVELHYGNTRIHALIEVCSEWTPKEVFRCFKAETLGLFNGPLGRVLGDKKTLGMLSEQEETGLFNSEEAALIRECIPWSRRISKREVAFRGRRHLLPELLLEQQEEFVIKIAGGAQGIGVHIGRFTPAEEWSRVVQVAVETGDWVVQEYAVSRPYLFQHGENGNCPHNVVWGTFLFGSRYGGVFLRAIPQVKDDGPINSSRGAEEALVLEV